MSRSVNRIILVGHIGRDPEVRETQTGTRVAHLSLATNRIVRAGSDEERERTDWHRLTLWDKLASLAEDFVKQGDRVYIEGRLEYDSYQRDGITIPTAEINVREIVLLSPRRESEVTVAEEAAV